MIRIRGSSIVIIILFPAKFSLVAFKYRSSPAWNYILKCLLLIRSAARNVFLENGNGCGGLILQYSLEFLDINQQNSFLIFQKTETSMLTVHFFDYNNSK